MRQRPGTHVAVSKAPAKRNTVSVKLPQKASVPVAGVSNQ